MLTEVERIDRVEVAEIKGHRPKVLPEVGKGSLRFGIGALMLWGAFETLPGWYKSLSYHFEAVVQNPPPFSYVMGVEDVAITSLLTIPPLLTVGGAYLVATGMQRVIRAFKLCL